MSLLRYSLPLTLGNESRPKSPQFSQDEAVLMHSRMQCLLGQEIERYDKETAPTERADENLIFVDGFTKVKKLNNMKDNILSFIRDNDQGEHLDLQGQQKINNKWSPLDLQ